MHLDSSQSLSLYSLEIVPRAAPTDSVIVRATSKSEDCAFDYPKDAEVNLSECVGLNKSNHKLEWGLSEFQLHAKSVTIEAPHGLGYERHLFVELKEDGRTLALNLDDYLGLVEYYHEQDDCTYPESDLKNTNVVKLMELLKKDDPSQQMVYYQAGVGTYSAPGFLTGVGEGIAAKADEGVAWYLYQHVIDGYRYLMQTYRAGDQISIFGFSRGAYTARALAGMLYLVGLLPRHNLEQVPFAYQVYAEWKPKDDPTSTSNNKAAPKLNTEPSDPVPYADSPKDIDPRAFKRAYCTPVTIAFLGVWDTVGSVGALRRKTLPYIGHNPGVKFFRQALALDENRGNFIPSLWDHSKTSKQSALEVWFKGGHCDVGGGAGPPESFIPDDAAPQKPEPRLSNISLRWMVRQCLTSRVHILFDPKAMRHYRKHGILEERSPGTSESVIQHQIEALDAHDVEKAPSLMYGEDSWTGFGWRLLDKAPLPKPGQISKGHKWQETDWRPNNGAPRIIHLADPKSQIRLHASVYAHIQNLADDKKEGTYIPAAIWSGWEDGHWPILEEGHIKSVTLSKSPNDTAFTRALNMDWKEKQPPQSASWSETIGGWLKWR
ncbi:putative protein YEL023C [Rhizoctonia solani AG-1 IB]|uniref:T6SS Phospholipase effector Tle1-like catalytic domain-containing protein n=1 Tax=Thanatephorus cucumeris (strain AG1-IB / isolate 7/3/14) TaxID=1108050 RepID=M5BWE2_THACB|nr:putative protein YEL023C [Rhizoctonia solani AG-1 IB]